MDIYRRHEYAHDTDSLFALFIDAEEIEAKQEELGARNIRVEECESSDDGAIVRFVRELPAEVPGALKKFVQPWNTVEQREEWQVGGSGVYNADISIDIAGVPVTVTGTLKLEPTDRGCVNHVRLRVNSGIPFIGKTLAEFVAKDCKRLIAAEYDYLSHRFDRG